MAGGGVAEDVAEGPRVGLVSADEANLRDGVVKELLGAQSVGDLDAVEADVEVDAPLVTAHCLLDDLAKIKKREEKKREREKRESIS